MTDSIPEELALQIEQGYDRYAASRDRCADNKPYRRPDQTFADAMCEGSIVEGLSNGQDILNAIFYKRRGPGESFADAVRQGEAAQDDESRARILAMFKRASRS